MSDMKWTRCCFDENLWFPQQTTPVWGWPSVGEQARCGPRRSHDKTTVFRRCGAAAAGCHSPTVRRGDPSHATYHRGKSICGRRFRQLHRYGNRHDMVTAETQPEPHQPVPDRKHPDRPDQTLRLETPTHARFPRSARQTPQEIESSFQTDEQETLAAADFSTGCEGLVRRRS